MIHSHSSFKRKLGLVSFIVLVSLSCPNQGSAMEVEELSKQLIKAPQREKPYLVKDRPDEQLKEYYLSADNRACGFRVFGFTRETGIKTIEQSLHKNHIKKCIENEIMNLHKAENTIFKNLFPGFKPSDTIKEFARQTPNLMTYLDYVQNPTSANGMGVELCILQNICDGAILPDPDLRNTFGLMTALAHLTESNLYIYTKDEANDNLLHLTHRSVFYPSSQRRYKALFTGHHYNLLVDANDKVANQIALENEAVAIKSCTESIMALDAYPTSVVPEPVVTASVANPQAKPQKKDQSPTKPRKKCQRPTNPIVFTNEVQPPLGDIVSISTKPHDSKKGISFYLHHTDTTQRPFFIPFDTIMPHLPIFQRQLIDDLYKLYEICYASNIGRGKQGEDNFLHKILVHFLLMGEECFTGRTQKKLESLKVTLTEQSKRESRLSSNAALVNARVTLNHAMAMDKKYISPILKDSPICKLIPTQLTFANPDRDIVPAITIPREYTPPKTPALNPSSYTKYQCGCPVYYSSSGFAFPHTPLANCTLETPNVQQNGPSSQDINEMTARMAELTAQNLALANETRRQATLLAIYSERNVNTQSEIPPQKDQGKS